jgi:preprotein translocase subunit SecG
MNRDVNLKLLKFYKSLEKITEVFFFFFFFFNLILKIKIKNNNKIIKYF